MQAHLAHSEGFLEAASDAEPGSAVDLGSGGGIPGLVLASRMPARPWWLIEARARRARFLRDAIDRLGLAHVEVCHARAEDAARTAAHRGRHALVVGRGFGPPPLVAECAAPLLRIGGLLVVSEPPEDIEGRWPSPGLDILGLRPEHVVHAGGARFQRLRQDRLCPERFPRRVPAKRPLFRMGST